MSRGATMTSLATSSFDSAAVARRLLRAHKGAAAVPHAEVIGPDAAAAYAVQDATLRGLGPVGGWKVGAKGPSAEPACAPLPAGGLFPSGTTLLGPPWRMRGIELEVAVRLRRDLVPGPGEPEAAMLRDAIEAVLPVIEVVETRLADWRDSPLLAQLADLQSHGGLVLGAARALSPAELDLAPARLAGPALRAARPAAAGRAGRHHRLVHRHVVRARGRACSGPIGGHRAGRVALLEIVPAARERMQLLKRVADRRTYLARYRCAAIFASKASRRARLSAGQYWLRW